MMGSFKSVVLQLGKMTINMTQQKDTPNAKCIPSPLRGRTRTKEKHCDWVFYSVKVLKLELLEKGAWPRPSKEEERVDNKQMWSCHTHTDSQVKDPRDWLYFVQMSAPLSPLTLPSGKNSSEETERQWGSALLRGTEGGIKVSRRWVRPEALYSTCWILRIQTLIWKGGEEVIKDTCGVSACGWWWGDAALGSGPWRGEASSGELMKCWLLDTIWLDIQVYMCDSHL